MISPEAKVELVTYKTGDMSEAATALITNFVKYSGILGARGWIYALDRMLKIIELQKPQRFFLDAQGIRITFSGFPEPKPQTKKDTTIFETPEPNFTIEGKWRDVPPRERTKISVMTANIGKEISDVYHLREQFSPYTLAFPKDRFAKERIVFDVAIL